MPDSKFQVRKEIIDSTLAPGIVAEPLASKIGLSPSRDVAGLLSQGVISEKKFHVIIELNSLYPGGLNQARQSVLMAVHDATNGDVGDALSRNEQGPSRSYVFACLTPNQIIGVIRIDGSVTANLGATDTSRATAPAVPHKENRAIFRIWDSNPIGPLTVKSIRTVKADAAQSAYSASGENIVWAVMDSGIDHQHPHFQDNANLSLDAPLQHKSFVGGDPLADLFGHGTHVAGIIAGIARRGSLPKVAEQSYDGSGSPQYHIRDVPDIRGMAPKCKLLSLQVFNESGGGDATSIIQALEYIQELNNFGKMIVVHGVNISAGYPFEAQWYACGQTPVCVEVDRLVRAGVVVVVAAGNTGHVSTFVNVQGSSASGSEAGQSMSINDPGNADLAITVGSTDREKPHLYGISYYSSKGPTGDGRCKPDVVAPGEHIVSAAAGSNRARVPPGDINNERFDYIQDTGTSMAAPHVSGIIAGFLSIRTEFIGQAEVVRQLVTASALDLKRDRNLQGAGLVDLMRLIQSV